MKFRIRNLQCACLTIQRPYSRCCTSRQLGPRRPSRTVPLTEKCVWPTTRAPIPLGCDWEPLCELLPSGAIRGFSPPTLLAQRTGAKITYTTPLAMAVQRPSLVYIHRSRLLHAEQRKRVELRFTAPTSGPPQISGKMTYTYRFQVVSSFSFFIFHLSSLKKPDTYPMFSSHRFLFCTAHPTILHHSSIICPGTSISTPTYTPVLSYIYQGKLWGGYDGRPRARARAHNYKAHAPMNKKP